MQTVESTKITPTVQTKATQEEPFFAPAGRQTTSAKAFTGGSDGDGSGFFKPLQNTPIQAKLTIGQPGDKYEQEADRMAERVVSQPVVQRQELPEEEEKVRRKPLAAEITPLIQRQKEEQEPETAQRKPEAAKPEEDLQRQPEKPDEEQPVLQTKSDSAPTPAPATLQSRLDATRGGGNPLPKETRTQMENAFGANFGQVRIHTGSDAAQMNKDLSAQAFTHGSDVYFNEGKYQPETTEGRRLLGHELVHVVQQNNFTPSIKKEHFRISSSHPRISRWIISGRIARSNNNSDTLTGLAQRITGNPKDWVCIWQENMKSKKSWSNNYPQFIQKGDTFDISNLFLGHKNNQTIVIHGNDIYLNTVEDKYGGIRTLDLYNHLSTSSMQGKTPISNLVIGGHTRGTEIWGTNRGNTFNIAEYKPIEPIPSGIGAKSKMGPHRCWFSRNAQVRIVGCSSKNFANSFSKVFGRKGTIFKGTAEDLCAYPGRYFTFERLPCSNLGKRPYLWTSSQVDSSSKNWISYRGKL